MRISFLYAIAVGSYLPTLLQSKKTSDKRALKLHLLAMSPAGISVYEGCAPVFRRITHDVFPPFSFLKWNAKNELGATGTTSYSKEKPRTNQINPYRSISRPLKR
ncbi:hypothetical protein EDD17DRAFT_1535858 [Pisolithus thermaeus]|nr:hypothetical protein EDD17DRAFT_1535858 [Pisolithus thermaeus]